MISDKKEEKSSLLQEKKICFYLFEGRCCPSGICIQSRKSIEQLIKDIEFGKENTSAVKGVFVITIKSEQKYLCIPSSIEENYWESCEIYNIDNGDEKDCFIKIPIDEIMENESYYHGYGMKESE
jgi:hypothetical protein